MGYICVTKHIISPTMKALELIHLHFLLNKPYDVLSQFIEGEGRMMGKLNLNRRVKYSLDEEKDYQLQTSEKLLADLL